MPADKAAPFDFNATPDTFWAPMRYTPIGAEPVELDIEWRYRTQAEFAAWLEQAAGRSDADIFADAVVGWRGFAVEYSKEALAAWLDKHPNAAFALLRAYREALTGIRLGN